MRKNATNKKAGKPWLFEVFVILAWAMIPFLVVRGAFADPKVAVRLAQEQGYTHIQIVEKNWFAVWARGCGKSDPARVILNARRSDGTKMRLTACVAWPTPTGYIRSETPITGGER